MVSAVRLAGAVATGVVIGGVAAIYGGAVKAAVDSISTGIKEAAEAGGGALGKSLELKEALAEGGKALELKDALAAGGKSLDFGGSLGTGLCAHGLNSVGQGISSGLNGLGKGVGSGLNGIAMGIGSGLGSIGVGIGIAGIVIGRGICKLAASQKTLVEKLVSAVVVRSEPDRSGSGKLSKTQLSSSGNPGEAQLGLSNPGEAHAQLSDPGKAHAQLSDPGSEM
ncbi:uncharacterized protein LOC112343208 [Selaginella moellendorffii]|uniref:uncharacterized protein LOC112343208 n=1 Tax=Selaginella moellendorffii TaxID=88036 RepID=UPI000D1C706D|nr:uncharacterized protein LOC112343208 [Selaginella moellendorffii]|eukprot:XP_024522090.1 uncharacterized protein LOC112343208 [Selaginella moellendorffii]